jgi:hypothetical protein
MGRCRAGLHQERGVKGDDMNRRPAAFLTVALLLTVSAAAQVTNDNSVSVTWRPCTLHRDVQAGECLFLGPPVSDAPFSADVVTTWQPPARSGTPELRATSRYYRDRRGRMRAEQTYVNGASPRFLLTPEAASRTLYVLDPVAKTAYRSVRGAAEMMAGGGSSHRQFVLPLAPNRWMSFRRLPSPSLHFNTSFDEKSLGERMIAGIRVIGTEYTATLPAGAFGRPRAFEMRDERWVSPELNVVVIAVAKTRTSGSSSIGSRP